MFRQFSTRVGVGSFLSLATVLAIIVVSFFAACGVGSGRFVDVVVVLRAVAVATAARVRVIARVGLVVAQLATRREEQIREELTQKKLDFLLIFFVDTYAGGGSLIEGGRWKKIVVNT